MMKRKENMIAAGMAGILFLGLVLAPAADVSAASDAKYSKNENVYVRMDYDGDIDGTYVVNTFTVTDDGEITDYGDYSAIKNLTNLEEIEEDKEEYTFVAEEGKFYYQGDIENAELPWKFDIKYLLDDKEVTEEELAGGEGDLEIRIHISENKAAANPAFFQAYVLQVSATLDNDLCRDIVAEGANIADAGSNEKITFTVVPNPEQPESDLVIKAAVENFEMDDISIAGAAATAMPVSFVSDENKHMGSTMFVMSAKGIAIPDKVEAVKEEKDDRSFLKKFSDKLKELMKKDAF